MYSGKNAGVGNLEAGRAGMGGQGSRETLRSAAEITDERREKSQGGESSTQGGDSSTRGGESTSLLDMSFNDKATCVFLKIVDVLFLFMFTNIGTLNRCMWDLNS